MEHNIDKTNFKQSFFYDIEPIKLTDSLASTLGVVKENEIIYFYYSEIVKYAGHSCLAVSGAFMISKLALKELYGDDIPKRGEVKVRFKGNEELNVNGPISQVISFITGAAGNTGFKGLGGEYNRYKLLSFDENEQPEKGVTAEVEVERMDTGDKVQIAYRPSLVQKDPAMGELMPLVLSGSATEDEKNRFGNLWQDGVNTLLNNTPHGTFVITKLGDS